MSPLGAFGTWESPLSAADVAAQRVSRYSLASDGTSLWWLEGRPSEGGRVVLVRSDGGDPVVVSPEGVSIRSRVHEYGGGAWCLLDGGAAFAYVDEPTQRVHAVGDGGDVALGQAPPEGERWRHGGLVTGPAGSVVAVRERHRDGAIERSVVRLDRGGRGAEATLCAGRDFYGALALSPGATHLAWVTWSHPDMPWDATELWVGDLDAGGNLSGEHRLGAGAFEGCSVDQPVWLEGGSLACLTDAGGWWQPWLLRPSEPPERLVALEAEFQGPSWALGQHTLVHVAPGVLGCIWRSEGVDHLGLLEEGGLREIAQPCVELGSLCVHGGGLALLGASATAPAGVWAISTVGAGTPARRVAGAAAPLEGADVSVAEPVAVAGEGGVVHALFYPPHRRDWHGPADEAPPLVVVAHGGPTAAADAGFDAMVQMFTTRGYAVAFVNYAGSSGYGQAYRSELWGRWGERDVDDCVAVARWLAGSGRVDGARMAIRGSSAGGLSALGALVRSDAFAAAVSWYGVSDLARLASSTHDFEAHYMDRLVGPLPESLRTYEQRSPVHRVADITGSVLLFQGEDDPVVPAEQTRAMAAALEARGVRCTVRYFAGESHGFRRAETLTACYDDELAFYEEVLVGPAIGAS